MSNVDKVLAAFESFAGQQEEGGNDMGPFPTKALASVGLGPGQPWCAACVNLAFVEGGVHGWPATGDTWAIQAWARNHNCYKPNDGLYQPVRGDVIELVEYFGPNDGIQPFHVGMVTANNGDGTVDTIEGNSYAPDDSAESGPKGVHRHVRPITIGKYVHWQPVLGA